MKPNVQELAAQVERLRASMLNMRADLFAYRVFVSGSIIAMTPAARATLLHNVQALGERALSQGLATSRDPSDETLHAMQAALDRVVQQLRELPSS